MNERAVADTGTIIHLAEIGQESCLTLFDSVMLSRQVADEVARYDLLDKISSMLREQLIIRKVAQDDIASERSDLANYRLHEPDLSVVVLASEMSPDVVLTDDLELRKALESLRFTVVGTVGVLVRARQKGRLSELAFNVSVEKLLDSSSLYLNKAFRDYIRTLLEK